DGRSRGYPHCLHRGHHTTPQKQRSHPKFARRLTPEAHIEPNEPDNLAVLAQVLALTGRAGEALEAIERALRFDPTPPDWHRQVAGLSYLLAGEPARATEELGPLYGAGTFASKRWWPGWLFAASLAHAGRSEQAAMVIRAAQERRPERSIAAVAQSFDGFADRAGLGLVLDGLRIAGMPG
ncbi:tetratricopeptide repeat protein, partial [Aurantimonas sp. A2-1-M11]|uniref:tetratricopeptide repeat protein n=1 Tax=Aurantimonas sp. A2-1-M11 TaxID=3113712 RepID=UPI002F920C46